MQGGTTREQRGERVTLGGRMRDADVQALVVERARAHVARQRGVSDQTGEPRSGEITMRVRASRGDPRMQGFDAELLAITACAVHGGEGARAELREHHVLSDRLPGGKLVTRGGTLPNALE